MPWLKKGLLKMNLFVKPDEQSQTCLNFAMARKGLLKMNLFVKPDEQSQTCLNFAMARKGLLKMNSPAIVKNRWAVRLWR
ncbi:MAG: hypothetical protein K6D57_07125 [Paludibacteraceae bacterium]|nr:hypothetical protein [Paludibacteraceae bacterium]